MSPNTITQSLAEEASRAVRYKNELAAFFDEIGVADDHRDMALFMGGHAFKRGLPVREFIEWYAVTFLRFITREDFNNN